MTAPLLPPPSPTESVGPSRWEGGDTPEAPDNELLCYVRCPRCRSCTWDGGSSRWPEQRLDSLLEARQFLEDRLQAEPPGRCPGCGERAPVGGVRLFIRSETLEMDLVVDTTAAGVTARLLDATGVSPPLAANDPRARAAFRDGACRAAVRMARLGPERARRALRSLERLAKESPHSPEPWIALAQVRLRLEHPPAKIRVALERAQRKADGLGHAAWLKLAKAWGDLANSQVDPGSCLRHALAAAREAVALEPEPGPAHLELGRLLLETDRVREAEQELVRVIEVPQHSLSAAYLLGRCALQRGAGGRARSIFSQLIESTGPDPHFVRLLAVAEAACGEHERARSTLAQARRIDPEDIENEEVAELLASYEGG